MGAKASARAATFRDILNVGNVGFQVIGIVLVEWHAPQKFSGGFSGLQAASVPSASSRVNRPAYSSLSAATIAPVRVAMFTSSRRFVSAHDIFIGIGEDESTFGIGVEDLDCLSAHRADNVPRPLGIAARHVFGQRGHADDIHRGARSWRAQAHRPSPMRRRTYRLFICHMPVPGFREMPPLSKVMPFPTKASGAAPPAPRYSTIISREGRRDPWPTPTSRPHVELAHGRFVEHFDANARRGAKGGANAFNEGFRIDDVGRLGRQIAREAHAFRQWAPATAPFAVSAGRVV